MGDSGGPEQPATASKHATTTCSVVVRVLHSPKERILCRSRVYGSIFDSHVSNMVGF
jgi:hypothetical protein